MPNLKNTKRPLLSAVLHRVREKMEKRGLSVADLAREIGKPQNYHQVYDWVVTESFEPKGEVALRLQAWADGDEQALKKSLSATRTKQLTAA